jgi:hypothetical protein
MATAMNANSDPFNLFDPTGMFKEMRYANMEAWAKSMVELVNTAAYADATGAMLNAWLTSSAPLREAMEKSMTQVLSNLNLPSRDDVTRLAERLTNIEMRLDDLEAKLDENLRPTAESVSRRKKPSARSRAEDSEHE